MKLMILISSLIFNSYLYGHGGNKPGPHGGKIKMPGMFHTELLLNSAHHFEIYLLDMNGDVVQGEFTEPDGGIYSIACSDDACSTPSFASSYVSEFSGYVPAGLFYVIIDGDIEADLINDDLILSYDDLKPLVYSKDFISI